MRCAGGCSPCLRLTTHNRRHSRPSDGAIPRLCSRGRLPNPPLHGALLNGAIAVDVAGAVSWLLFCFSLRLQRANARSFSPMLPARLPLLLCSFAPARSLFPVPLPLFPCPCSFPVSLALSSRAHAYSGVSGPRNAGLLRHEEHSLSQPTGSTTRQLTGKQACAKRHTSSLACNSSPFAAATAAAHSACHHVNSGFRCRGRGRGISCVCRRGVGQPPSGLRRPAGSLRVWRPAPCTAGS